MDAHLNPRQASRLETDRQNIWNDSQSVDLWSIVLCTISFWVTKAELMWSAKLQQTRRISSTCLCLMCSWSTEDWEGNGAPGRLMCSWWPCWWLSHHFFVPGANDSYFQTNSTELYTQIEATVHQTSNKVILTGWYRSRCQENCVFQTYVCFF